MQLNKNIKSAFLLFGPKALEFFLVLSLVVYHVYNTLQHQGTPSETGIGYVDWVHYIRAFDDVLQGKVLQKDFYWFYGPLYLYFQVPFYTLFGANHSAVHILLFQFLPALGIIISYFYICFLIRNPFLRVLFLITCIFHWVNSNLAAPRHLGAELGIAFFLYSFTRVENKYISVLAGILVGIGLLSGSEYGIPALLAIFFGMLLCQMKEDFRFSYNYLKLFFLGICLALAPFVSYMVYQNALWNYIVFTYDLVGNFGINNPGRGALFPPMHEISFKGVSLFFESLWNVVLSQAFRFYLPLFIYFVALVFFGLKFFKKGRGDLISLLVLATYGLIIYYRTLTGPAYGYFVYGMIPAITIGFLFLEYCWDQSLSHLRKRKYKFVVCHFMIILVSLTWIYLTLENKNFLKLNPGSTVADDKENDKIYYDKVGFEISKKAYEQYEKINKFIIQNTDPDEYVFVYPCGPFNHFTGRPSPLTARDGVYDLALPGVKYVDDAIRELEERKPNYIILNTYNGGVQIGAIRDDVSAQVSWGSDDSPNFAGTGNPIEFFILENYFLVKKFEYGAILKRNSQGKKFIQKFRKTNILRENIKKVKTVNVEEKFLKNKFYPISRNIRVEFVLEEPILATHMEMTFQVHTAIYKKFATKGFLNMGITDSRGSVHALKNINDLSDLGEKKHIFVGISRPIKEAVRKVKTIWLTFDAPSPYLIPERLDILDMKLVYDLGVS